MPRQNPGGTVRRRSADRFRSDVQLAAPQVVAASIAAGTAFDTSDVETLSVELRLHEFLRTALTGTNNDLDIIARDPAVTDITVSDCDLGTPVNDKQPIYLFNVKGLTLKNVKIGARLYNETLSSRA